MSLTVNDAIASWVRNLRARNLSPRTIGIYQQSADQFARWLAKRDMTDVLAVGRDEVAEWLAHLVETRSAATARIRYKSVQQLFSWLVDEDELEHSPMARLKPPMAPEQQIPVLELDELRALFATCERGKDFIDRRDHAILRLFADTGLRLSELTNLRVDDVDLDDQVARVVRKGRKPRVIAYGAKTTMSLDRYLRVRRGHRLAGSPALWLGAKGPLLPGGIQQIVARRGREAGIDNLHPHVLRHTFAHHWLAEGGNEGDLMRLAGWSSRQMLDRYGASAAETRAREAHRDIGLGDRV